MDSKLPPDESPPESSVLLARARAGDPEATSALLARYVPVLRRWAHGRLRDGARDLAETEDLVQGTLMRVFLRLESFEEKGAGGFPAYLRQTLENQIRDVVRRARRRPARESLDDGLADPDPTPLANAVRGDVRDRYERAFARLTPDHQLAVALRLELGMSHAEVGEALGGRSANAARLLLIRAVSALAEDMQDRG
jgi:RNA polymerase sigma-70 factor (ECF subfamily)